jgi:hypothetical protein
VPATRRQAKPADPYAMVIFGHCRPDQASGDAGASSPYCIRWCASRDAPDPVRCGARADALIFNRDGTRVAVVNNGKAEMRQVRVTRDFGTRVEVISGVKAGDQVSGGPQPAGQPCRRQQGAATSRCCRGREIGYFPVALLQVLDNCASDLVLLVLGHRACHERGGATSGGPLPR